MTIIERRFCSATAVVVLGTWCAAVSEAQTLEKQLAAEGASSLATIARRQGNARRGAIAFFQPHLACAKCHSVGGPDKSLGPDLSAKRDGVTDVYIVESLLSPSKVIRKGYDSVTVVTDAGKLYAGIVVRKTEDKLVLREADVGGKELEFIKEELEDVVPSKLSIMPTGQVDQLANRRQFLDLACYLMEIAENGPERAAALQPDPSQYAPPPIPEYEKRIDHAGMIADLDRDSYERGAEIYNRLCINCHGTRDKPGSLPTSRRFSADVFKNGNDPFSIYQTLTYGVGLMTPQTWMVPQQKYDVIHYIREAYLKKDNPSQYRSIDQAYFASLPVGDTRGPNPQKIEPWVNMDYGMTLNNTYEIGADASNIAHKSIAVRLDAGPGGISRGKRWTIFDHDTLRIAAVWSAQPGENETRETFIDWNGIHFNGRHGVHPRTMGDVHFTNPAGPGWANPANGSFDDPRFQGRDGKRYGPLPRSFAHYKGLYHYGNQCIVSYSVGKTNVLEMPGMIDVGSNGIFTRAMNLGPRDRDMVLQVARRSEVGNRLVTISTTTHSLGSVVVLAPDEPLSAERLSEEVRLRFDGSTGVDVAEPAKFDLTHADYTIAARIRTHQGGALFCKTAPDDEWVPDGKVFFVRNGRLCFDIGWVGDVESQNRVNDGKWHDVAVTWNHESAEVRLYLDGRLDGRGRLRPNESVRDHVVRLGYAASNFPTPLSYFEGEVSEIRFYQKALDATEIVRWKDKLTAQALLACWDLDAADRSHPITDTTGHGHDATIRSASTSQSKHALAAGIVPSNTGVKWLSTPHGDLRIQIPAGNEPLHFTVWTAAFDSLHSVQRIMDSMDIPIAAVDLHPYTQGGPQRWPQILKTQGTRGSDNGPFAIDVLTHPDNNPWLCQMRLTGFDFYADSKRAAVCSWDGDVWLVDGVDAPERGLAWQRMASGLFQPLGLKIVDEKVYVACRDQIVVLNDLNDDGEADFYENFNNDHQVTEHFHEFAMGLQTDAEGNFYYAKSARHALPAIVPHHGTLLRVSKDGQRTDILAKGFRAANGVCINPDGTFFVTDQEGHWTPKNRINWVHDENKFYGNMLGYHDVTDNADEAMEQPLCWITNEFDRSPAELIWIDTDAWGPLHGSLLNFSYGYGKVYLVPHEQIDGQIQGGMCELPIPQFPTGTMRARFHPVSGQLYTCGMFAWAGSRQEPGGFFRIRYTGKPVYLPVGLCAKKDGIAITFSGELDPESTNQIENYTVKVWSLKRTANYGSDHYNEHRLAIRRATLSQDHKTVYLEIPDLVPTWCMEIRYVLRAAGGGAVRGKIHNTIHRLGSTPVLEAARSMGAETSRSGR